LLKIPNAEVSAAEVSAAEVSAADFSANGIFHKIHDGEY
jgi:hypothetical protein